MSEILIGMKVCGFVLIGCGLVLYGLHICQMVKRDTDLLDQVAAGFEGLFLAASFGFLACVFQWL